MRRCSIGLGTNSVERQAIEFAIFLLYVLDCVPYTDDELTDIFFTSSTLNPEECLYYVSDEGVRPKPKIYPLVSSCNGQFTQALERCQKERLVYEAGVVLRMSGDDELYTRFLPWILSVNSGAAVAALVQRHNQQQQPSASLIIPMLIGYGGYPLHEYLHHLIYFDNNTDSQLHTLYATNLIDIIHVLQSFGVEGLSANAVRVQAGYEYSIRGATRRGLLTFLQINQYYDTDTVLSQLLESGLKEEQVLVLKQAGDHLGALTKLVYELDDVNAAVRYCEEQHSRDLQNISNDTQWLSDNKNFNTCEPHGIRNEKRDELSVKKDDKISLTGYNHSKSHDGRTFNEYFNILLHVLLVPTAGKERLLSAALAVLNEHSYCINPLSVMTSLPDEVCVTEIWSYLLRAFQTLCNKIQVAEVNANKTKSMIADAQRYRDLLHQRCVYVDEKRMCAVCGKPLGVGVIAVFPNLMSTHFRCFQAPLLDPERGVPFRQDLL
ncbi:Vacuolar sorting protein 39/Transforming growth factor beta receptor-associated domain 2 [Trypanosoma melophagium]|uniref:Vacuolar sorting protein 39/Transforming growth factor beta receptor-associated domain 2 n=1 Tax=Trypanosoma melophagium TaxID=715481 RepID=UPI003519E96D|nr:Vacuolar sorting protein 39/Transforming growth factor beta receptor-associated domain 2 [Trypanosoma melophagium]